MQRTLGSETQLSTTPAPVVGQSTPAFRYQTVRTSRMTFEAAKIRHWMLNRLPTTTDATILNACAGETKLTTETPATVIRNDIDTTVSADLHVDVSKLAAHIPSDSIDVVIHDPPYSATQSDETYGTSAVTRYGEPTIAQFRDVLRPGGQLIQWGYSPQLNTGFSVDEITLWNRVGRGFDFVSTVQTFRSDADRPIATPATASVQFNPQIDGVTSDASFGGNNGRPVEMSFIPTDGDLDAAVLEHLSELIDGITLIISDRPRDYRSVMTRSTALLSLVADAGTGSAHTQRVDTYGGIWTLSEALPSRCFDTVIIDVNTDAFCWNCYYEADTNWPDISTRTGYVKALKTEAERLLVDDSGRLIQIGQTATNCPSEFDFTRTHVGLSAAPEALEAPLITVDERADYSSPAESRPTTEPGFFWPAAPYTAEQTKPTTTHYRSGRERLVRHPAYLVVCPECGAAEMNCCLDGTTVVPAGTFHEARVDRGEQKFYSSGLCLPLREYVKSCVEMTDPARPVTGGGSDIVPPAAQDDATSEDAHPTLSDFR